MKSSLPWCSAAMAACVAGVTPFTAGRAEDDAAPIFGLKFPLDPRLETDFRGP